MAPYYSIVTSTGALPADNAVLESLEKANKEELNKLEEKLEEAKKQEGESDIADALKAKANYYTKMADKVCHSGVIVISPLIHVDNLPRRKQSKGRRSLLRKSLAWDRG